MIQMSNHVTLLSYANRINSNTPKTGNTNMVPMMGVLLYIIRRDITLNKNSCLWIQTFVGSKYSKQQQ